MSRTNAEQTLKLVVDLPEPVFRLLAHMAKATHQSLEALAAQSIAGNLPPLVENAPPEMQDELLAMQAFSNDELMELAHSQVPLNQQERHLTLLEKSQSGSLASQERQELSELRLAADRLMVCKAYAWAILRWRGQRVPQLSELPAE